MFQASDVLKPEFNPSLDTLWQAITDNFIVDEDGYLEQLLTVATPTDQEIQRLNKETIELIETVRGSKQAADLVDSLLQQYSLDTEEGIILMCLAEALLRIPDKETADQLIRDKLTSGNWNKHVRQSDSFLVNASSWGLLVTGKVVDFDTKKSGEPTGIIKRMVKKAGEPAIRQAMKQAMKIMAKQFVLGRDINEAIANSEDNRDVGYTHSYDMLGEAAYTRADAAKYFADYSNAIDKVGKAKLRSSKTPRPTISIKLSALHPKYDFANREAVLEELGETVAKLVKQARSLDVGVTIDAEEVDRLELSLELFKNLYQSDICKGWGKMGLVVQAYSKRALPVLMWLNKLAEAQGDEIPLRLVKGAYWDTEIKLSQQEGIEGYPVFTRKAGTDVSYLACAQYLLSDKTKGNIYPQFASHNAHTVTEITAMAKGRDFEFQRLHGMGKALYDTAIAKTGCLVRIYAPVGAHKDLLPYLVRRLLENGANSSFVHQLLDPRVPAPSLAEHPVTVLKSYDTLHNNKIPLPLDIYGPDRKNSKGFAMNINSQMTQLMPEVEKFMNTQWQGYSLIDGEWVKQGQQAEVTNPFNGEQVGTLVNIEEAQVEQALASAAAIAQSWDHTPVVERAAALDKMADLMETHRAELIALCTRESGKSIQDGIDEVREAVDFCRYYAFNAKKQYGETIALPGPTGELNEFYMQSRGVFACISPWNFPLAIFIGQVVAALAAGNAVIAKPAAQSSLIATRAVELLVEAGIPAKVITLLLGSGAKIGNQLTSDNRIDGVAFTGSTEVGQLINLNLAKRTGAMSPFIAETGGQNAMIVDSSALPEQVVSDVVESAFTSAGQRCSALRVLFVQDEIADRIVEILKGAMAEIHVGNPAELKTDCGPVIDRRAQGQLLQHIRELKENPRATFIAEAELPAGAEKGSFVPPTAFEIDELGVLTKENFGPVLHIVRFKGGELDKVIGQINDSGFGLTLGVHSRNEQTALYIERNVRVGNVYINRNMIGATVGVQPFGGQGLSGTGPKAGGPNYLLRFGTERTRTTNTAALGGNADLLSLD